MTTFTPNFDLDLYEGTDKPDLADQYAAAMQKIDTALQAALEARAELQNSIGTLNINLTATNKEVSDNTSAIAANSASIASLDSSVADNTSAIAANSASIASLDSSVASLKTEVDKNTPLVEAHVNYFADLGVTDDQSAQDLHEQIDQSFQGVMSNTQSITALERQLGETYDFDVSDAVKPPWQDRYNYFYVAVNKHKNILKFYGMMIAQTEWTATKQAVPGVVIDGEQYYGIKLDYDTGLRLEKGRYINNTGIYWRGGVFSATNVATLPFSIGTDGYIYVMTNNVPGEITLPENSVGMLFQCPVYLGAGEWGVAPEQPGV
jgi:hypothetical protein